MRGDTARCDRLFLAFYHTPVVSKGGLRRNIDKIVFGDSGLTRNELFFLVITERYLNHAQSDVKAEHERFSPASLLERRKKAGE